MRCSVDPLQNGGAGPGACYWQVDTLLYPTVQAASQGRQPLPTQAQLECQDVVLGVEAGVGPTATSAVGMPSKVAAELGFGGSLLVEEPPIEIPEGARSGNASDARPH